jgi:predicted MFS family arabinose efflux permease
MALCAPLLLATGYAPGLAWAAAAYWVRGLLTNTAWPLALNYLIESVPERQRGRVSGLMNVSFELSYAAATFPTGFVMERLDPRLPYAAAAAILVAGSFAFALRAREAAPEYARPSP